ncbi:uncharacterized protein LOC134814646 [Bolinopsis microptera]|uniref:uncharacterized protein LOC134814646 n=1 Tax=Bolinopsis microptera TaxID=2820187 RepID=UPI003079E534
MEVLLLRKPKPQPQKPEQEITFTGLNAETKRVAKKGVDSFGKLTHAYTPLPQIAGLELSSLHGPTNSPELEVTHEVKATRPPIYEEPPMVNLLDLATVAPKPPPLFTLNDFVSEALVSQTIGTNLRAPLKSRENFETFHATPNGVTHHKLPPKSPPVLHVQDVLEEVEIPEAEPQRIPKQQKLIEMRAMIRQAMQSADESGSDQTLCLMDTPPNLMIEHPYPNTNALFTGGLSRFFQGEARSGSPFCVPDESCMTVSRTAVFNALKDGGRKLSLRAHFITLVPDITPMSLTLVDLNLSFNNFRTIPVQALHLPNLVSLTFRNNPIIQLPTDMSGLPKLAELNLSFCLIHYIPDGFFSLPAIEELNLSYNHLTEVPASVVHLSTLQHLNLEGNQLPALPFSLLGLTRLQSLYIKNNFTSQKLWGHYSSNSPMSLKDMCAKLVVDFEMDYRATCSDELSDWVESNKTVCECCGGNLVGEGLVIVRSVMERTFGVRNLPLSLLSCSLTCFYEYKRMKNLDVAEGSTSSLQGMTLQQLNLLEQ